MGPQQGWGGAARPSPAQPTSPSHPACSTHLVSPAGPAPAPPRSEHTCLEFLGRQSRECVGGQVGNRTKQRQRPQAIVNHTRPPCTLSGMPSRQLKQRPHPRSAAARCVQCRPRRWHSAVSGRGSGSAQARRPARLHRGAEGQAREQAGSERGGLWQPGSDRCQLAAHSLGGPRASAAFQAASPPKLVVGRLKVTNAGASASEAVPRTVSLRLPRGPSPEERGG